MTSRSQGEGVKDFVATVLSPQACPNSVWYYLYIAWLNPRDIVKLIQLLFLLITPLKNEVDSIGKNNICVCFPTRIN